MKINRTKNAKKNIIVGIVLKVYQMILPFIMRTIMIYYMGAQYLGLNSLFTSVLQVLNLAELGVGSAMVYSMYKPIAEDDTDTICALMKLYRHFYRIIGLIIGVVGTALTPFIPYLIKNKTVPDNLNIYVLYLLNLAATVLTYWLFAYKNCLLTAHQRSDVGHSVLLVTITIQYLLQSVVVIVLRNYYLYVVIILFCQILCNIITAMIADKMYPNYSPRGELPEEKRKDINTRIKDLFTSKLGMVITNSADTVVISAFLGLEILAIYQNYFYILSSIIALIEIVFTSILAGLGNSFVVETKEKNMDNLKKLTFIIMWIVGVCSCCFINVFQPFMEVWVGKELMLSFGCVITMVVYFYVYELNRVLNVFKDAAGLWHKDRFRPLVTSMVNLSLNLLLVNYWGLYGILLSTVFSMVFVGMPWLCDNIFTNMFSPKYVPKYILNVFIYLLAAIFACATSKVICDFVHVGKLMSIVLCLMISLVISNLVFLIALRRKWEFAECLKLVKKMIGKSK